MDKHLENVHLFLPNLKIFISLNTTRGITDKTLENFAKLKNISTIIMNTGFQNPSPFTQLIKSYPKEEPTLSHCAWARTFHFVERWQL
jgi:hypothetical protein